MNNEQFPHQDASKELFWRDVKFANYHINHDKLNFLRLFDVTDVHRFLDDFDFFDTDHYTITTTEAGSEAAVEQIVDHPCGLLELMNDNADDDSDEVVSVAEAWVLTPGHCLYWEGRFKLLDGLLCDAWAGIIAGDSLFAGVADGVYFLKDSGSRRVYFVVEVNGVPTAYDTGWDAPDLTFGVLAFHWDGAGNLRPFVFQNMKSPQTCLYTNCIAVDIPTNILMTVGFGVRNGEADHKAMYIDYHKIAMERYFGSTFEEEERQ